MDVDTSVKGIPISFFQTIEPENARDNRIPSRGIWFQDFPRRYPRLKDLTKRLPHAYFNLHHELSKRSRITSQTITDSKSRRGDRIESLGLPIGQEH
jgi:hypothetical protein